MCNPKVPAIAFPSGCQHMLMFSPSVFQTCVALPDPRASQIRTVLSVEAVAIVSGWDGLHPNCSIAFVCPTQFTTFVTFDPLWCTAHHAITKRGVSPTPQFILAPNVARANSLPLPILISISTLIGDLTDYSPHIPDGSCLIRRPGTFQITAIANMERTSACD